MGRKVGLLALLLLLLGDLAVAAPSIALVQILSGEASLNGANLSGAQLAKEGDTLIVAAAGKVRVQLLGSSKECILGGGEHALSRVDLELNSTPPARGELQVKKDLGSLSSVAGLAARNSPIGFRVHTPRMDESGRWMMLVEVSSEFATSPETGIYIYNADNSEDFENAIAPHPILVPTTDTDLILPSQFTRIGQRYLLQVHLNGAESYERTYRLLNPEDKASLDEEAQRLRELSRTERSVGPLLKLAKLYQGLDQNVALGKVLREALDSPFFASLSNDTQVELYNEMKRVYHGQDIEAPTLP